MVWYDATGGRLAACAHKLVGQSLAPPDLAATYERVCGDFWYYVLQTYGKIERGEEWAARYEFNFIVTGLLHALLRLEAGAVERWRASELSVGIERVLSPHRLAQLNDCIPGPGTGQPPTRPRRRGGPWARYLRGRQRQAWMALA